MFNNFIIKFLLIFCFINIFSSNLYAEKLSYEFLAITAKGSCQIEKVDGKDVILINKTDRKAYIDIIVPQDGYYQLYISLWHNWKKFCPFLYVEAIDSKDKHYLGHIFSEPRWYLEKERGRWEFRSPSANPFWYLHKGKMRLRFYLKARLSPWEQETVVPEGYVAIKKFILILVDINNRIQLNIKELEHKRKE